MRRGREEVFVCVGWAGFCLEEEDRDRPVLGSGIRG